MELCEELSGIVEAKKSVLTMRTCVRNEMFRVSM